MMMAVRNFETSVYFSRLHGATYQNPVILKPKKNMIILNSGMHENSYVFFCYMCRRDLFQLLKEYPVASHKSLAFFPALSRPLVGGHGITYVCTYFGIAQSC
jgi:hypothetical protein